MSGVQTARRASVFSASSTFFCVQVPDNFEFEAFGGSLAALPSVTRYLFAGEQFDVDLNSICLRVRYYNVTQGRFLNRDSFAGDKLSPPSLHRYIYSNDSQVNYLDPSGMFSIGEMSFSTGISNIVTSIRILGPRLLMRAALNAAYGAVVGAALNAGDAALGGGDPAEAAWAGAISGAEFGALSAFKGLHLVLGVAGLAMGSIGVLQSINSGHYYQAGYRGILAAAGALSLKSWKTIEGDAGLPRSLSNAQARAWYKAKLAEIPSTVDQDANIFEKAMHAYLLRAFALVRSRGLMADVDEAGKLPAPMTLSDLILKAIGKGYEGDGVWQYIYDASQTSNAGVDSRYAWGDAGIPFVLWSSGDSQE